MRSENQSSLGRLASIGMVAVGVWVSACRHQMNPEAMAVVVATEIANAQMKHHAYFERYATLADLERTDALRTSRMNVLNRYYELEIVAQRDAFRATFRPRLDLTGAPLVRRSFYVDESRVIRHAWLPHDVNQDSEALK